MRYVKYFEAFNPDDFDPDIIASNLYQYSQEWPKNLWGPTLDIIGVTSDRPTLNQILNGIENLIDEAKGSKLEKFLRYYESNIKRGALHIKLEEVEDLFLDIPEYTIQKTNKYDSNEVFNILVDIKNVEEKDLQYINNHIYGTVKSRLPDTLYIKRVTVLMEDNGKYDIKIRLFENSKSIKKSKDATEDLFVPVRGGNEEDDRPVRREGEHLMEFIRRLGEWEEREH